MRRMNTTPTFYGPQPVAKKELALGQMLESAKKLTAMLESGTGTMTAEQFEMEIRLQLMWITCGINQYHEGLREEVLVQRRMQKAGWLL